MNSQKQDCKLFCFRGDIQSLRSKIKSLRSQRLRGHTNFSLDMEVFIFLNYCCWNGEHTQVPFLPDYSFKICEKPLKLSECVCVVLSMSP